MKNIVKRRGARGLVFVGIVGALTLGLAAQASACVCPQLPPTVKGGLAKQANPNNTITTSASVAPNEAVVVSLATGTFAGDVTCSDNTGPSGYSNVIDRNVGSGRLVVCVKPAGHAPVTSVTATYPGFSGLSVIQVVGIQNVLAPVARTSGSGSYPTVDSGTITNIGTDNLLFGVVYNTNTATFSPDSGWTALANQDGGAGAGRRNLTAAYRFTSGPPADYALKGTPPAHGLTGSGFWSAAIIQFPLTSCN